MEKVLRESDNGILVYIAPTKALVNQVSRQAGTQGRPLKSSQIAADVHARFRKNRNGSTSWLYTCDGKLMALQQRTSGPFTRATTASTILKTVKF